MQSAQICGRKRGARVSGERRARKSESRRVFTGRGRKKKLSRDAAEARVPLRDRVSPRVSRAGQGRRDGPRSRVLVSAYHSRAEKGLIGIHGGEDAYAPRCRAAAAARARWPQPRETPWPRLGKGGRVSARLTRRRALSTSPEHVQPGRDRDACAARSVASDAPVGLRAAASVSSVPSAKTQVAEVFFLVRLEPLIFFRRATPPSKRRRRG